MKKKILISLFLLFKWATTSAQNNRLNTNEKIGWYNYFGTFKVSEKVGIHTEYQFGRQINGQNVFQNNNGLIINANFNIDLTKKPK